MLILKKKTYVNHAEEIIDLSIGLFLFIIIVVLPWVFSDLTFNHILGPMIMRLLPPPDPTGDSSAVVAGLGAMLLVLSMPVVAIIVIIRRRMMILGFVLGIPILIMALSIYGMLVTMFPMLK